MFKTRKVQKAPHQRRHVHVNSSVLLKVISRNLADYSAATKSSSKADFEQQKVLANYTLYTAVCLLKQALFKTSLHIMFMWVYGLYGQQNCKVNCPTFYKWINCAFDIQTRLCQLIHKEAFKSILDIPQRRPHFTKMNEACLKQMW
jgi:hypothetical protein